MAPAHPRCLDGLTTLCHVLVDLTLSLGLQASAADHTQAGTAAAGLQELAEGLADLTDQIDALVAADAPLHPAAEVAAPAPLPA